MRFRWWWFVAAGVVLVAVGAFVVVRFVVLRDTTTAVEADDVLARYRASTVPTTAATAIADLPAPGVYEYETTGSEQVDALGGTTHTYPGRTTVTVTAAGCGVEARWDALEERWASQELCAGDGGLVSARYTDFHRFYGQDDRADWTCGPPLVVLPAAPVAGQTWSGACVDDDEIREASAFTVVALEPVTVAGQAVDAVHIQRVDDDTGTNTTARTTTDLWLHAGTGLLLRSVASSTSTTSSLVGDVHYTEQYELRLVSLHPRR